MASGPITSWQINDIAMERMRDIFVVVGLQNHSNDDCSHEIKRCLLLGSVAMTKWNSILKSRDITLLAMVGLGKARVFPVVIYGCESLTLKKAEHWRIDAFVLWYLRRLLRVPWTSRRSNQSLLKEISSEHSLEELMLKLKLQYFGHLMLKADSLEETWESLKAGGEVDDRGWGGSMASQTWWTWVWASSGHWWWTGNSGVLPSMGSQGVRHNWMTELNWQSSGFVTLYKIYFSSSKRISVEIAFSLQMKESGSIYLVILYH